MTPNQTIILEHLSFVSYTYMTFCFTDKKKINFKGCSKDKLTCRGLTIWKRFWTNGQSSSQFPAITYRLLHYNTCKKKKSLDLNITMITLIKSWYEMEWKENKIQWCINNNNNACHYIVTPNPDTWVYIDPSLTGWGITETLHALVGLWHKL